MRRCAVRSRTARRSLRRSRARWNAFSTMARTSSSTVAAVFLGLLPCMRGRWKIGAGQECVRITIIGDVAEFVGHSVACNHAARDVGDASQVVCGTCRKMTEYNQLGGATTERHRHLVLQFLARHQESVFGRA